MKISAFVVALALSAPAMAQSSRPIELDYTQFTLPNGLHVILHEDHSVPVVSVDVWYHVGSAREVSGRTGFAHLFEHLMFMGSGHVKPGEFDEWLEGAGGANNGSTANGRSACTTTSTQEPGISTRGSSSTISLTWTITMPCRNAAASAMVGVSSVFGPV